MLYYIILYYIILYYIILYYIIVHGYTVYPRLWRHSPDSCEFGVPVPEEPHAVAISIILILRVGILMSIGNFPEMSSQQILVGMSRGLAG